jgi:hypothetical protein
MDSCRSAEKDLFSRAFGIENRITSAQVEARPPRAQAFVGWDKTARGAQSTGEFYDYAQTYAVFYDAWMTGSSLDQCIDMASRVHPFGNSFPITLNFPLGMGYSSWEAGFQPGKLAELNDFHIRIYGYAGITREDYEPGHDNSKYYK